MFWSRTQVITHRPHRLIQVGLYMPVLATGYDVFDKLARRVKFPSLSQRTMAYFYTSNLKKVIAIAY